MDELGRLLNRPCVYYNIDGVGELSCGIFMTGCALLSWLQAHSPQTAVWHSMFLFVIYFGGMIALLHYGPKAIKKRITYPRTDFVAYRKRQNVTARVIGGVVAAIIPVVVALARHWHWNLGAAASFVGLVFAAVYGWRFARAVRWKWIVAGVMALGSLAIAFLPNDLLAAVADDSWASHPVRTRLVATYLLSFMIFGAILVISGGISFWLYLRYTQAPAREAQ